MDRGKIALRIPSSIVTRPAVKKRHVACWLAILGTAPAVAEAQESASQRYVVHVPEKATAAAPAAAELVHDGTDAAQAFPRQRWRVSGTYLSGLTVDFSAPEPFTHTGEADAVHDARLQIRLASTSGPAEWTVEIPADRTDHAAGRMQAVMRASTDAPGGASIDVGVEFVAGEFDALPAGAYELTLTATISPHP